MSTGVLLSLRKGSLVRYGSMEPVVKPFFSWRIVESERWAVVGKVGSGKSTLGAGLAGGLRWVMSDYDTGTLEGSLGGAVDNNGSQEKWKPFATPWCFGPPPAVRLLTASHSRHQEGIKSLADRYHSACDPLEPTVADFLLARESAASSISNGTSSSGTGSSTSSSIGRNNFSTTNQQLSTKTQTRLEDIVSLFPPAKKKIADALAISPLANVPMSRLSNGQLMRVRIARSLLFGDSEHANVLILDEPFTGLDAETRTELSRLLGDLSLQNDSHFPYLLLLMRPQDILPDWITHVLELDKLSVSFQGTRQEFMRSRKDSHKAPPALKTTSTALHETSNSSNNSSCGSDGGPIAVLNNVNVTALDGAQILKNINWTISAGERWGLTGSNGSGKTTLLSILVGDHPQAYSNSVHLFGHRRGEPGVSIWDIKQNIGFVSPEFHIHFSSRFHGGFINASDGKPGVTVFDAVCTGFGNGDNLAHTLTSSQSKDAESILRDFGLLAVRDAHFAHVSSGEQRMALIARALVKRPLLVIMDEPFQALDEDNVALVQHWLRMNFGEHQSLVFVSLKKGSVVAATVARRSWVGGMNIGLRTSLTWQVGSNESNASRS